MARKYLFVCDVCHSSAQRDSERLPDGWAVMVANRMMPWGKTEVASLDVCSAACACSALASHPAMNALAPGPANPALPPAAKE
jgi:hypothetical protein